MFETLKKYMLIFKLTTVAFSKCFREFFSSAVLVAFSAPSPLTMYPTFLKHFPFRRVYLQKVTNGSIYKIVFRFYFCVIHIEFKILNLVCEQQ